LTAVALRIFRVNRGLFREMRLGITQDMVAGKVYVAVKVVKMATSLDH
jgi:hypothetical protein